MMGSVWGTGGIGEGLHKGGGLAVGEVWRKWKIVRELAKHEPRLHIGKKLEVELGVDVSLQCPAREKGREGQERISTLKHTRSQTYSPLLTFEKSKAQRG